MKYLVLVTFILSITFLAFVPEQADFAYIVSGFALAFASYFLLIKRTHLSLPLLLGVGFVVRTTCIFAFPNLSDDIYRFIWDGYLLHLGESPFSHLPTEYLALTTDQRFSELYPLLNSPDYYSIYPPFAQLVFYLSTFSWMNTAVVVKLFLLAAEVCTAFLGHRLLKQMGKDPRAILWYVLNPLIIIEIMVNLHFEGFMVCFFVAFLYFLNLKKLNLAVVSISLAIAAKLIPLMFLPYFLFKWPLKKVLIFYAKVGVLHMLMFAPILFQLQGFGDSLDLYFRKFEFNASIYYLLRYLGNLWKGYNMISHIGPVMAISVFATVMFFAYKIKDFLFFCQCSLLAFLLLSTTIHPWYLSLGIAVGVFTGVRFFIFWSFLVTLSYAKYALGEPTYYFFISLEYLLLLGYLAYELRQWRRSSHALHPNLE